MLSRLASTALADEPGPRRFRMGFTPFPFDATVEALVGTREFVKTHGDIIAFHIEGVPWAECLEGQPFNPELVRDWEGQKQAIPEGGKVYLAISPGRGTLKEGEKSLPIPAELRGKPYDDPLVKRAYLAYSRRMVEFFRPDYLAIGIEVDEIRQAGPVAGLCGAAPPRLRGAQERPAGSTHLRLVHAPRDAQPRGEGSEAGTVSERREHRQPDGQGDRDRRQPKLRRGGRRSPGGSALSSIPWVSSWSWSSRFGLVVSP